MNQSNSQHNQSSSQMRDGRIDLKSYMPDPNKKNQLKSRLYDTGISNIPMPSVKRPIEETISSRPFSAKMNPGKIQNTSMRKKSIEKWNKNIVSAIKGNYEEAAVDEARYKGEGTAEYYKSQHILVPPPAVQRIQSAAVGGRRVSAKPGSRPLSAAGLGKARRGSKHLVPTLRSSAAGPQLLGMSSTNKILLNKGPRGNQLPPLSSMGDYNTAAASVGAMRNNFMGSSENAYGLDNIRILQGPPAVSVTGFEGGYSLGQKNIEMARSKFLVDKLTGKLSGDLLKRRSRPATAYPGALPPRRPSQRSQVSAASSALAAKQRKDEDEEEEKVAPATNQKWSDLDKCIELLLDSKSEEETVFVYLNTNPNADPYDLLVANYQEREQQKYYTLSGKGLTLYVNDTPIEFLSLGQWLIERDSYNHIKELNFFKKFKKWKFMRMWKKTIKHQARMKAKNALEEKLFMLQPHFSEHLSRHREYMLDMERQRFVDTCVQGETRTIEEFGQAQYERTKAITEEVQRFSEKSRKNIRACINMVLNELRIRIQSEIELDAVKKKSNPIQNQNTITMKKKAQNSIADKLGFPDGMTYGHRSSLRKECSRFLRFAYLVDFLSLQSLSTIYTGSVSDMIERLRDLDEGCDMEAVMNMNFDDGAPGGAPQSGNPQQSSDPLFYVSVKLCDENEIPEEEVQQVRIEDFGRESAVEEFDPLAHFELEEVRDEDSDGSDQGEPEDIPFVPIYKKVIPNIESYWLRLEPDANDYIEIIIRTFSQGLQQIMSFERWSKHSDLTPYADVLEEWDDIVGDSWDEPDTPVLDPKTWIQDNVLHQDQKKLVQDILVNAFSKMKKFLTRFQPILEIYYKNKEIDFLMLTNERLKNPIDSLHNSLALFNHYHELFSSSLPTKADIGLIQIDSKLAREHIQPTPKKYIAQMEKEIPAIIRDRNYAAKQWLDDRIRELKKPVHDVDEFVEQNEYYNAAEKLFQDYRDKVDMYGQYHNKLAEFGQRVSKDDKAQLQESINSIQALSGHIQNVESSMEANKAIFKKTLNERVPQLDAEINDLFEKAQDAKFLSGSSDMFDILRVLLEYEDKFKALEATSLKYNRQQEVLETQPTVFENLDECREQLTLRCLMWRSLKDWQEMNESWLKTPFGDVDAKSIAKEAENYAKICMRLEKNLEPNPIQAKLKDLVDTFQEAMPIVIAMRNDKLTEVHWGQIKDLIGKPFDVTDPEFLLKTLIDLDVTRLREEITTISTQATQESNLRGQLEGIIEIYKKLQFETKQEERVGDCHILTEIDPILEAIDQTLAEVNAILGSRFVKPLREEAEEWKNHIQLLSDLIEAWLSCQKNWMYLDNIFKGSEIKKALPDESKKFESVDKFFRNTLMQGPTGVIKQANCMNHWVIRKPQILEQIREKNEDLDNIQKSLDDYMEVKRSHFPRFYFLSNQELIGVLANSQNLEIIQLNLKTCFDNIVRIDIVDQDIEAMNSMEKEKVKFKKPQKARGPIETWLAALQEEMISTLGDLMKKGVADYQVQDRSKFVLEHKGQIVATVAQIMWCQQSESYIQDQGMNPLSLTDWYDVNVNQIEQLTTLVRSDLKPLERKVIVALVTTDVHARDVIGDLRDQNVSSITEFQWVQQLKYYWEEFDGNDDCKIRQVSAVLDYGYEYMGATSRLVITPLTDRCWITISNALHIKLGANPAGPAGTGKTESTKDLAKAIAIQCIVFNCSDQVDYIMMGRLFSGLAQQGCWTCLDEFNRIGVEVLSVIGQQLLSVRKALLLYDASNDKNEFMFEDQMIPLKKEFGCHVTMNPGYAGRTELPDNLKVLFRPVAMMIPNYALIAEIMLAAEGFKEAKVLSKKMTKLYSLSSEQLSQQDHYDFGLRAVKSVLVMAGSLKRENPTIDEDGVLIRAMRDANVPKFLKDDLPLFYAIIQDLFPTVVITENDYGDLKVTIEERIQNKDLQVHPGFVMKVIQLYETFNVRFGVMIVGPTGAGKTTCYETLADTMTTMRERGHPNEVYQNVNVQVLNPKSISMGEMYGIVDQVSQDWFDGLASKIMRSAAQETDEDSWWVVFDGPVDALWIENMNTVLDDNMTLCLSNGQRIKLRPQMKMLFEVADLAVASPATVSRCGMVYMTADELGWQPFVKTWIKTYFVDNEQMDDEQQAFLQEIFDFSVEEGLSFIRSNLTEPLISTDLQQVTSITRYLESFLHEDKGFKGNTNEKRKILEEIFAWSFVWSLGASLDTPSKDKFDSKVKDIFKQVKWPPAYSVFDYYYDLKKDKQFKPWSNKVAPFMYDKEASYFDLMVPTTDTTKYAFSLDLLIALDKPVFFTGNSGVGKSAVISNKLQEMKDKGGIVPVNINMSAQTSSLRTQISIEEKLEKKPKKKFGPPVGQKLVVFVDDINMPAVEEYGAQPPIELLRLFIDRKGFYQRGEWFWKEIVDTVMIACAAPPSGGRAVLTTRFSRRFNLFCMPEASQSTLTTIFSSILKNFLSSGFQDKVKNLEPAAITSVIEIYQRIQSDLRPTPAKFHYQFNLRDVSKVIQGICMVKPVSISNDELFMKLFVNESFRVFYDRLINETDRQWFKELILELLSKNFKMSPDADDIFVHNKIMYGDLLKLDSPVQYYECIQDKKKLLKILHGGLDEYNMSNSSKMNLVLFDDAIEHVLRIARVLKQPRGHIMLIGVGGSGKQSLIRLCTSMRQMEFKTIEITRNFGTEQFKEVMKGYMKSAGIEGTGISFVMTDTQIIDESFVENLNNLLNTGEIQNVMLPEDKDDIVNGVRVICNQRKIIDTLDNINNLFVARVRENLHICLCMSPVGDTLRVRCRQFPSLINCCTLDWFARWPEEALLFVSTEFLKEVPDVTEAVRSGLAEMCMKIHISVEEQSELFYESLRRRVYTTPKSYLDLISLYLKILEQKREESHSNKSRLSNGLSKLNEANKEIAELRVSLAEKQPILEQKNAELKVSLTQVNADKEVADEKDRVVSAEAAIVNKQAQEAQVIADDVKKDLDAAEPELKAAQKAVQELEKSSIVEIKQFANPPKGVEFVMQCVMILLGKKTDWKSVQAALQDVQGFMNSLLDYNVADKTEKMWKKARDNYISKPEFEPAAARKVSVAAASLCIWARATSKYQIVTKKVAPKKLKFAEVTEVLNKAKAELQTKLDQLQIVKDSVAALEEKCQKMQDEKDQLEQDMETARLRMGRAEKLVDLLKDEGVRWQQTVEIINKDIVRLVGNVFLSCACISYFGAFTGVYRQKLVDEWVSGCAEREIPTSEIFSLVDVLGDPVTIRNWGIAGLPSDQVSTENGILTTKADRYALFIDPQQQANKWIKNLEKKNKLQIMKFGQNKFLQSVTTAVRTGVSLLVEDVEEDNIDPALDPILLKQQYLTDAGIMQIRIGDGNVDFDEHFRFFMTTKIPNPHYIPEICIKVTLINMTVTMDGLEQQMLGDVVIAEKPEVEEKRDAIVLQMAADSKTLMDLENNILKLLSESTVLQILDTDDLINVLEDSKKTSSEINERMEEAKVVEVDINETRMKYNKVAIRGSILYFVIADLAFINPMYQNSLAYIKSLFKKAIAQSPQADTIEERLDILIDKITRMIYSNVARGVKEKDKLIFSFLMCTGILRGAKAIDEAVWNILLRGPTVFTPAEAAAKLPSPDLNKINNIYWDTLVSAELRSAGQFEGITESITDNWDQWSKWSRSENPFKTMLPREEFDDKLQDFDKLLLIKCFRNELLPEAFSEFIIRKMTKYFVEPPSGAMEIIYPDLSVYTPLVYILTTGADPTAIIMSFAKEKGMYDSLYPIALGQGQGKKAEKCIQTCCEEGGWVMLQNCHLYKSWMLELEKIVLNLVDIQGTVHEDFRLFLTSMPDENFPTSILQNSVKLTVEPPKGMKANIKRTYQGMINQNFLDDCSKPEIWRKLLFTLSYVHSVFQERRKFGPLGWNILYEFNDSDLETTFTMLRLFLDSNDEVPWDSLTFITGHINYGGRVTDDNDRRCLINCLEKFLHDGALKDGFKFSDSGLYYAPTDGNLDTYQNYIETFPLNDSPEIFGLHENANINYQEQESLRIIDTILSIQPRLATAAGGLTPDEIVLEKSKELLEKLPTILDKSTGSKELFFVNEQGLIPSLSTVLTQEMAKFNRLLKKMRQSLIDIDLAVKGFIVMSEELDLMYLKIQNNQQPLNWIKVGYPSLKPLSSWYVDLLARIDFFQDWLTNGNPNSYWLPGMFFPQGFMTGVLQTHARQYKIAIDALAFAFEFLPEETAGEVGDAPEDGVFVHGLFFDGARWDRAQGCIVDQIPTVMFDTLPVIHFKPQEDFRPDPDDYITPLYKTSLRAGVLSTTGLSTNFVLHVATPSREKESYWIQRGAAMLCMLND